MAGVASVFINPWVGLWTTTAGGAITTNPGTAITASTAVPADNLFDEIHEMVASVTLEEMVDVQESTSFGGVAVRNRPSYERNSLNITFNLEYGATESGNLLRPLKGQIVRVKLRSATAAQSATNPDYLFDCVVAQIPSFGGGEEAQTTECTWPIDGVVRFDAS